MTAVAIFREADAITIASDGACYDAGGLILQIRPKVDLLPNLPAVLAGTGSVLLPRYVENLLFWRPIPVTTFDGLLDVISATAREAFEHVKKTSVESTWKATLFLCGYSADRDRLETYALKSYDLIEEGKETVPAFTVMPLPAIHLAPAPSPGVAATVGLTVPSELTTMPDNAQHYTLRSVVACRFCPGGMDMESAERDPHGCVGGFLQLTILNKHGVTSQVVHRWPDVLGQRIDLDTGFLEEQVPLWLMPPEFFEGGDAAINGATPTDDRECA